MEFLSVGGIKLKVTLSPEECEAFGIEHKEEGEGSQISRESVKKILAEARIGGQMFSFDLMVSTYFLGDIPVYCLNIRLK